MTFGEAKRTKSIQRKEKNRAISSSPCAEGSPVLIELQEWDHLHETEQTGDHGCRHAPAENPPPVLGRFALRQRTGRPQGAHQDHVKRHLRMTDQDEEGHDQCEAGRQQWTGLAQELEECEEKPGQPANLQDEIHVARAEMADHEPPAGEEQRREARAGLGGAEPACQPILSPKTQGQVQEHAEANGEIGRQQHHQAGQEGIAQGSLLTGVQGYATAQGGHPEGKTPGKQLLTGELVDRHLVGPVIRLADFLRARHCQRNVDDQATHDRDQQGPARPNLVGASASSRRRVQDCRGHESLSCSGTFLQRPTFR